MAREIDLKDQVAPVRMSWLRSVPLGSIESRVPNIFIPLQWSQPEEQP